MSEKTHYFLALRLPDSIKKVVHHATGDFQKQLQFQRWVHNEDYHITLAFLGNATQNQLIDVEELVAKQIEDVKPFSLTISHIGTFGKESSPRIFWAGLDESMELQCLRDKVYNACGQAGFQLEKRDFHPHITVARKWAIEAVLEQTELEKNNVFSKQPLTFRATEVVLYKTNLLQTPKYENVITFSLQS